MSKSTIGFTQIKHVSIREVLINTNMSGDYRIVLESKGKDAFDKPEYIINIRGTQLERKLNRLLSGKTEREYFSFFMTNIDFYRHGKTFAISWSPYDGYKEEYVLKKGMLETLIHYCSLPHRKEDEYKKTLQQIVTEINNAKENGSVIFASDINELLAKVGIEEKIEESTMLSVNEKI